MNNKTLGIGWLASLGMAVLIAIMESSWSSETISSLYGIDGLAMLLFGIWGAIRLINLPK